MQATTMLDGNADDDDEDDEDDWSNYACIHSKMYTYIDSYKGDETDRPTDVNPGGG
jgi:hypothetical protein